ncbi:hypothetical protein HEQ72_11170 [Haematospirillum sp. 15-248]|uniref:hypothetical protein n=1 Tax=Haematospirillum sp. 15-248 TaxID=2723107 RepID=UPI0014397990|nr:hypothetical protein [Haematospirillum sp. 15-248]NKD88852.1 hypothetical protein [Haematospirillum sp. 15-248]
MAKAAGTLCKKEADNDEDVIIARVIAPRHLWNKVRVHGIMQKKTLPEICTRSLESYLLVHEHNDLNKFLLSAKKMNIGLWDYVVHLLEEAEKK